MTRPLEPILKQMIAANGPIDLGTYMRLCLTHPDHGYYTTRDTVIGRGGDFITAPEISQLFGEMIGFWIADLWAQMGRPKRFILAELGPGRGTLMADVVRILSRIPGVLSAISLHLVEVSAVLIAHQAQALQGYDVTWYDRVDDLPHDAPLIIVNNEFFDALPVRQYIVSPDGSWDEVVVGVDDAGALALGRRACHPGQAPQEREPGPSPILESAEGPGSPPPPTPPPFRGGQGGDVARDDILPYILERSPDRDAVSAMIFARVAAQGGAVLTIDYGYDAPPGISTIQAVRAHQKVSILDDPGACDITALVDFVRLSDIARAAGLAVAGPVGQGAFLTALGVDARLRNIINHDETADRAALNAGLHRLIDPGQMGELFKVMCAYHPQGGVRPEGFFV